MQGKDENELKGYDNLVYCGSRVLLLTHWLKTVSFSIPA
jgi:hypothetical protein